jgi:hypothetical protein
MERLEGPARLAITALRESDDCEPPWPCRIDGVALTPALDRAAA